MKRKYIAGITIALVIVSFLIPIVASDSLMTKLQNAANIFTILSTIVFLVIGLILFNQYGIDQPIIEKKFEAVSKLLDLLSEKRFEIETNIGYTATIALTSLSPSRIESYNSAFKQLGGIKILFNSNYSDYVYDIVLFSSNRFLPPEISKKIQLIEPMMLAFDCDALSADKGYGRMVVEPPNTLGKIEEISKGLTGIVSVNFEKLKETMGAELKQVKKWSLLNAREITVTEFVECWYEVLSEVSEWLNKNKSHEKLNIKQYPPLRQIKSPNGFQPPQGKIDEPRS